MGGATMRVLVDTDVLIDILRQNARGCSAATQLIHAETRACSVITVAEIRAGMRPAEEQIVRSLLGDMDILDISPPVAWLAGALQQGHRSFVVGLPDCLIAATASVHGLTLFTHNRRHYPFESMRFATA